VITAGFTLIGRGAWTGGETYLRNMLGVIADELRGRLQAKLFLTPEQHAKVGRVFDGFLAEPAVVDERVRGAGEGRRAMSALVTGCDRAFADLVIAHGVDVMFQSAQWHGEHFPIPLLSWIPDFQHRHLPHLMGRGAWWKRDLGFSIQARSRHRVMLSSQDAERDCVTFYPKAYGKTGVVRFAIDLDPAAVLQRVDQAKAAHGLPDRYLYLPNQFWSHKNHQVVVDALARLARAGDLDRALPVILTGRTDNPADPGLFERLMADVGTAGVASHFRHLGMIPYDDVFALNAGAIRLLNPSRFEGWSTTVEEAKALGTPMLLSDISLHREQAPDAAFFDTDDPDGLARLLLQTADEPYGRAPPETLRERHATRRGAYAEALMSMFEAALA
jgi:glycosyltransferase involved in cell wall biosynthesis